MKSDIGTQKKGPPGHERPQRDAIKKVLAAVMHAKPYPVDESSGRVERKSVSPRLVNLEPLTWDCPALRGFAPSIDSACNPERPQIPPVLTGLGRAMPRGMKGIRISKITNTDRNITETNAGRGTRNRATPETGTRPAGNSDMDEDSDKDMGK